MVYFEKISEDDISVRYLFGWDPDDMNRTLSVDKEARRMLPDDENIDYMFRKTISKIGQKFDESGEWPAKGMSVS